MTIPFYTPGHWKEVEMVGLRWCGQTFWGQISFKILKIYRFYSKEQNVKFLEKVNDRKVLVISFVHS